MRRRFKVQRKSGPPPVGRVFIITLMVFFITVFASLEIIDKRIKPTLIEIANQRIEQVARMAISQALSKKMAEDLKDAQLNKFEVNESGEIISYGWDPVVVNIVQRNAQDRIENYLKRVERGDPIPNAALDVEPENNEIEIDPENLEESSAFTSIPLGQATNNTLLANLGPQIPIRFTVIGVAESNIVPKVERVGINNAFVELTLDLKVTVQIVVPFATEKAEYTQNIYLDGQYIPGEVPDFYGGGDGKGPQVTVPYDSLQ